MKKMPGIPEAAMSEEKARDFLERTRWANGAYCPHCKAMDVYRMTPKAGSTKPGRSGLLRCRDCKKQFTVTVGTIFERSHIPLHKWLLAVHFMTSSKKGISAHQLHRMLGITYACAWHMAHRIRLSMKQDPLKSKLRGIVEVDETYIGGKVKNKPLSPRFREGAKRKIPVLVLVSRNGEARSFPVERVGANDLRKAITENVDKRARLMTDEWKAYKPVGKEYASHEAVNHSALEYTRGDVYTNTAESFFAILKRGVNGTFHHVTKSHLGRYCDEFSFRWNHRKVSDEDRAIAALKGAEGKRLMYKQPMEAI